jgi:hypothetical protein
VTDPQASHARGERSRWTLAGLLRAVMVAGIAIGVGAGLGYFVAHEPAPADGGPEPVKVRAASAAELALVAPLAPGSALADFVVTEVLPIGDSGALRVVCARGEVGVALDVALAAEGEPTPPARAGRYAIFYALRGATPAEGEQLAAALAAFLEHNAGAATPAGMGPYRPDLTESPEGRDATDGFGAIGATGGGGTSASGEGVLAATSGEAMASIGVWTVDVFCS